MPNFFFGGDFFLRILGGVLREIVPKPEQNREIQPF